MIKSIFSRKKRSHLLKLHLYHIGKGQNMPCVTGRLVQFKEVSKMCRVSNFSLKKAQKWRRINVKWHHCLVIQGNLRNTVLWISWHVSWSTLGHSGVFSFNDLSPVCKRNHPSTHERTLLWSTKMQDRVSWSITSLINSLIHNCVGRGVVIHWGGDV